MSIILLLACQQSDFHAFQCEDGPILTSVEVGYRYDGAFYDRFGESGVAALRYAAQTWSEASCGNLIIEEGLSPVLFEIGLHSGTISEQYSMDGIGGDLAIAFDLQHSQFPGKMFLDAAEPWAIGAQCDVDEVELQTIVTHEIGHLLGLCHLKERIALMHSDYKGPHYTLEEQDKIYFRNLYGWGDCND